MSAPVTDREEIARRLQAALQNRPNPLKGLLDRAPVKVPQHIVDSARDIMDNMVEPLMPLVLAEGVQLSVQAGNWFNCSPKDSKGPWTHFEVKPHFGKDQRIRDNMPLDDVLDLILAHGGLRLEDNWQLRGEDA